MKKAFIPLFFSLLLLVFACPVFAITVGDTAPDFRLPNLDGKKIALSDFKGQTILLKLATTWCPTCKDQSREIASIADFLQAHNVVVVEVFVQDTETMVRDYLKGYPPTENQVVLLDNGKATKAYNLYVIPRVLLLDGNLKVVRDGNLMTGSELKKQIEQIQGQ